MKNVIFYFSGTGNSLAVARHIAKLLKDTEVINILDIKNDLITKCNYERVGFVFPVYYLHMPKLMKEILSKVKFKENQYIFGVIAHAGSRGLAMGQLREIVNKNGGKLSAEFRIRMPGNYIVEYGGFLKFICETLYKREQSKVIKITSKINKKQNTDIIKVNLLGKLFYKNSIMQLEVLKKLDEGFHVNDKCIQCKVCKNVCPVNNITILDDIPIWNNNCEQCMACIQWCPVQAIEYLNKTKNRKHYTHPEIKVEDIMKNFNLN